MAGRDYAWYTDTESGFVPWDQAAFLYKRSLLTHA